MFESVKIHLTRNEARNPTFNEVGKRRQCKMAKLMTFDFVLSRTPSRPCSNT